LPLEIDALSLLSEALNFDFATKGMDEAFTDSELAEMSGLQASAIRVLQVKKESDGARVHPDQRPRPRAQSDRRWSQGGRRPARAMVRRARLRRLRRIGDARAGRYEDFVRFVVPELQRRGLFRKDFTGRTLRDNLGIPVP
jgi:hypothetical protein